MHKLSSLTFLTFSGHCNTHSNDHNQPEYQLASSIVVLELPYVLKYIHSETHKKLYWQVITTPVHQKINQMLSMQRPPLKGHSARGSLAALNVVCVESVWCAFSSRRNLASCLKCCTHGSSLNMYHTQSWMYHACRSSMNTAR